MVHYFSSYFAKNLIFALAYFLCAYVGLLLAIPPTSASPVWAAAGVALAGCYLYGRQVAPGLLLGAGLAQFYAFFDNSSTHNLLESIIIGSVVSLAAFAQAALGARLIKYKIPANDPLLEDNRIFWFLILGGPVSCILAATIGTTTLLLFDAISNHEYLLVWATWWIGDSIGVLVFTPLLLVMIAPPRALWRKRFTTVALPLGFVFSLLYGLFIYGNSQERHRIAAIFEQQTTLIHTAVVDTINRFISINSTLKNIFNSFPNISEEEFLNITQPLLKEHSGIQALEWIPHIRYTERDSLVSFQHGPIVIYEPDASGTMVPVQTRPDYYPVYYLQPYEGNERALGYDVSTNPDAFAAIQKARDTGRSIVTGPIRLIQDLAFNISAVIYTPVYQHAILPDTVEERREQIKGVVAGVFHVSDQIAMGLAKLKDIQVQLDIHDETALIYSNIPAHKPHTAIPLDLQLSKQIPILNRTWALNYYPTNDFFHQQMSWNVWWLMLAGFSITGLTGMGLLMLSGRTLKTEDLVKIRTLELEREVAERKLLFKEREAHNKILQAIIESQPLEKIFNLIITTAESIRPDMLCSILLLDPKKQQLHLGAAPNLPAAYHAAMPIPVGLDIGSCGSAAASGERVTIENVHTHPSWANYRDLAKAMGVSSCWSDPIRASNGDVIGTFAIYYVSRKSPDEHTRELIDDFAKLTSLAIEKKNTEDQIVQLALYDALTGLPNRRLLLDRLQQEILAAQEKHNSSVILFLDLDNFKTLNDSLGHRIGDNLLIQVAERLQACCRPEDMAARLGGDEFVVMLSGINNSDTTAEKMPEFAMRIAQRIQSSINEAFLLDQYEHHVSCSIGIAIFPQNGLSPEELLQQADTAMYTSKSSGRNSICFYHTDMQRRADKRLEMEKGLKRALDEQQFVLYYQPQYNNKDQQGLVSAEVLLRWQHP
ncbi:MAG: diguanylate cyclase, partial [Candidatus Competibacteraceae bacterium]|nr:diguanylate cyclase [Candidatus Competibacteraceae bacterium]